MSLDQYFSPYWASEELLKHVTIEGTVFDPCYGHGELYKACTATNDLDPSMPTHWHLDARAESSWNTFGSYDWIISNPPFHSAHVILQRAYEKALIGVAFHLRLSFLEPTLKRQRWLVHHPPDLEIVLPRYSFNKTGKDLVTCAWLVWYKLPYIDGATGIVISDRGM